jgi:hypothetical protein
MEAQIDMKVKVLVLLLALMALAVTASAQKDPLDPGEADSVLLVWSDLPDLQNGDSTVFLDVIVVNDEVVGSMGGYYKWTPEELDLTLGAFTDDGQLAFDFSRLVYYKNRLDSSNRAQKFQCTGFTGSSGLSAGRTHIARYTFKLTVGVDSLMADTSGTQFSFVTLVGSIEFKPRFGGSVVYRLPQAVEIGDGSNLPTNYALSQNYPNPFNPETSFEFSLPKSSNVELAIFNVLGQKVITLINEKMDAGTYRETWRGTSESGASVASGIYFYRLTADEFVTTKKMMMLK